MSVDPLDRHREPLEALRAAVLESRGVLPPQARAAAAERSAVPARFAAFVGTIHDHAYRVTDRMVAELKAAGASEDEIFELSVASAYGAARSRLDAALAALREATGPV